MGPGRESLPSKIPSPTISTCRWADPCLNSAFSCISFKRTKKQSKPTHVLPFLMTSPKSMGFRGRWSTFQVTMGQNVIFQKKIIRWFRQKLKTLFSWHAWGSIWEPGKCPAEAEVQFHSEEKRSQGSLYCGSHRSVCFSLLQNFRLEAVLVFMPPTENQWCNPIPITVRIILFYFCKPCNLLLSWDLWDKGDDNLKRAAEEDARVKTKGENEDHLACLL